MNQQSPICPTCRGIDFKPIAGTSGKLRCQKCGWLIVIVDGKVQDAVRWTTAGRTKLSKERPITKPLDKLFENWQ